MQVISSDWLEMSNLRRTESKPAVRFEVGSPCETIYCSEVLHEVHTI